MVYDKNILHKTLSFPSYAFHENANVKYQTQKPTVGFEVF